LLEDARKQAIDRLVVNATTMGANAIVMMRFDSSEIGQNMSEVLAYGTAVIIEKDAVLFRNEFYGIFDVHFTSK